MQSVPCPCCRKEVCAEASSCVNCGYQPETEKTRIFLRALQTITSILLFAAAGLINLSGISEKSLSEILFVVLAICWFVAAILFLVIVVSCEVLLHNRRFAGLAVNPTAEEFLKEKCNQLIPIFIVASGMVGTGLICLAFYYAWWLGLISLFFISGGAFYVCSMSPPEDEAGDEKQE